jgi:hypothetical protein
LRRRQVHEVQGTKPAGVLEVRGPSGGKIEFKVEVSQDPQHDAARITVTEQCARPTDLHQAKVQIETQPDMVRRQYFLSSDGQEVRHEFIYKGKRTAEVLDYWVSVTSREELERGAFHLHEAVELKVP